MENQLVDIAPIKSSNLWKRLLIPISLILGFSLAYFYLLLQPPVSDLRLMTILLTTTAIISTIIGVFMQRLGWMAFSPSIAWSLLAGYIVSGLITFFIVWVSAHLMFTSEHDLRLSIILLLFATGIAVTIQFLFNSTLIERISQIRQASINIAQGNFKIRVNVKGQDEIADLGRTFNGMADQLEKVQSQQNTLDELRKDLIAWISHDLQTPLTSIRAMVEALLDGVVEEKITSTRYLQTIQREVNDLSGLIDDLFQMAQIDANGLQLEISPASLPDLISDTLESMHELAIQRGIQLAGSVSQEIDLVPMDSRQIGRVLSNLISNALRHTPQGGIVNIFAEKQRTSIVVSVSDTGQGIRKEDLPFIFDRFYRGEKSRSRTTGGSGLGLTIAKGIIEAHHGSIGVESGNNIGSKFWFTLPIDH